MTEDSERSETAVTRVGIGIVRRGSEFLVRQRRAPSPLAGLWEFAGGKCEPGEPPAEAAARECREEIGIGVEVIRLRRTVRQRYPHAVVELHFFDCLPEPREAEPDAATGFQWVELSRLGSLEFPEGNQALITDLLRESG